MDTVLNEIHCSKCDKRIETPVVLPCGHSTCKKHTTITHTQTQVICPNPECQKAYPCGEFPINHSLVNIIAAKIGSINFGEEHRQARENCREMEDKLKECEELLNNPKTFIQQDIESLKNRIDERGEFLKQSIDETIDNLKNDLLDYEGKCIENLKAKNFAKNYSDFESFYDALKSDVAEWKEILNDLEMDPEKVKTINEMSNRSIDLLQEKENNLRQSLMMNDFDKKVLIVENFENVQLDPIFEKPW